MRGWILYFKTQDELTSIAYGVNRFLEVARARNIDLKVYSPQQFDLIVSHDPRESVFIGGQPVELPDFVLPRLGSSTSYFALALLRQLSRLGVRVFNSADAIETVKDKLFFHQLMVENNIPTPKTMLARFPITADIVSQHIGFPVVVKNITGTEGQGICLSRSETSFTDLMELIYSHNEKASIMLQQFIESSQGQDLRVFVVGGRVIGTMRRHSTVSFKANFSRTGGQVSAYHLSPDIEQLAINTANLVNLDIAGVDLLFDDNHQFLVCEANSSPGFRGMEQVVGPHIAEDIMDYISREVILQKAQQNGSHCAHHLTSCKRE